MALHKIKSHDFLVYTKFCGLNIAIIADFLVGNIEDLNVKLGKDANNRVVRANTQWLPHTTAFTGDKAIKHSYRTKMKTFKKCSFFRKLKNYFQTYIE